MKKLIVLIISLLLLVRCSYSSNPTPVRIHTNEPTKELFDTIEKFEFEGHNYIWFRSLNGGYAGYDGGIIHDPNCHCYEDGSYIDYD